MLFNAELILSLDAGSEQCADLAAERIAAYVAEVFGPNGIGTRGLDAVVARASVEVVLPNRPAA
jgi:hypothetical protein